jgi:hypothetical protein
MISMALFTAVSPFALAITTGLTADRIIDGAPLEGAGNGNAPSVAAPSPAALVLKKSRRVVIALSSTV